MGPLVEVQTLRVSWLLGPGSAGSELLLRVFKLRGY